MSVILRAVASSVSTLLAVFVCAGACSNDTKSSMMMDGGSFCSLGPACRQISRACMPKDDGSPSDVHTCHMAGMETGIESQCEQMLDKCIMTCNAAPGFGDAGAFGGLPLCDGGN